MTTTNTAINSIKPSELLPLAEAASMIDRFLMIVGSGGAGKTSMVCNVLGPAMGREVWEVNLNGQGPQETTGYLVPDSVTRDGWFSAPEIWPTLDRVGDRPVLLFLDEVNDYDPQVRALLRSLYPASGKRKIGSHTLGTNVFVVCATNRRCDGTRSAVEDAPFTERCIKVTLEPNVGDWLDWYDTNPKLAACGSHVPSFLRFGTTGGDGLDHFNPPVVMPYDGAPHPCPRTWEAVALLEPIRTTARDIYRKAVKGCIGDRAASAFFGFLQHVDKLPDIAALRANADTFQVPDDPASQFALVSACLSGATRGVKDIPIAVHSGGFDWLVTLLLKCRGDIREFGARSAERRGIPLSEHPKSHALILG
jgi:hypothetical protein